VHRRPRVRERGKDDRISELVCGDPLRAHVVADPRWAVREVNSDTERQLNQVLVGFARTLGTDFSVRTILDHLVAQMVGILPITGAGVMMMGAHDELHFIAASNDTVTFIETLQNELEDGPCLEAYRTGEAVSVTDLSTDTRFPEFSARAADRGLAAVFTFPMRLDDHRLGAVDLYRDTSGALAADDLAAAQILADVAAAFLSNAQARVAASTAIARADHRNLHDPLTGLPNRVLLEELLGRAVARARRSHHTAAVLFADLDGFKSVNDRHGHHVGDELLQAAAGRLAGVLRPGDTLARLGGDEFVVVCEDLVDVGDAETVAERMTTALAAPFTVADREVRVGVSVGIAFAGPGQDIPSVLLRDADFAMYQAKSNGGGHHRVLDPLARVAADRRDDLERDLAQAQDRDQLTLAYQPILDLRQGRLAAVESLLRWQHPQRGAVPPAAVIPSAERTGLIRVLGEWVLRRACTDMARWRVAGVDVPAVAVNVSAQQVMDGAFSRTVRQVLAETGVEPSAVLLELTETVLLADSARALTVIEELKGLGVRLSLDDFGTGYSSLNYLRQFPFDIVKIDQSFTADVFTDAVTRSIVGAMIELGHALGATVTAEGVETTRELGVVTGLGADHAQGFLLSHPLTFEQVADYAGGAGRGGGLVPESRTSGPVVEPVVDPRGSRRPSDGRFEWVHPDPHPE